MTGENEVRVADNPESQDFRVRGNSLWVLNNSPTQAQFDVLDLSTHKQTHLSSLAIGPPAGAAAGFDVSPDRRQIIYTRVDARSKATSCWSRISTETPESRANRKFLRTGSRLWEVLTIRSMFRWNRYGSFLKRSETFLGIGSFAGATTASRSLPQMRSRGISLCSARYAGDNMPLREPGTCGFAFNNGGNCFWIQCVASS